MKSTLIAASLALATSIGAIGLAQAASVTVSTDHPHPMMHRDHGTVVVQEHHRHCIVKVTKIHHHGKTVVKRERVCR